MKSAVTVSLVAEAVNGPFLFHGDVAEACRAAVQFGFDGIELFAPGPTPGLKAILTEHNLALAAVGTGAGWVRQKLSLTSTDAGVRQKAIDFIASMIDFGAEFGAPAILGSMQGRWDVDVTRERSLDWLADALQTLAGRGVPFLYEPLNRYETNLFNTLDDAERFLDERGLGNVKLLADLFHMNIEETDIAAAIRQCKRIGHVHLADSNRGPAGHGHTDFAPIGAALHSIKFEGFISAEAFPKPSSMKAAEMTMRVFQSAFRN